MEGKNKQINAIQLDENMSIKSLQHDRIEWHSPKEPPFHIAGFPWLKTDMLYRRLPVSSPEPLPKQVDELANCTAGGQIRFRTNSSKLLIKVKLAGPSNMYHMAPTGQCGFDCYVGDPGNQYYLSTTKYDHTKDEYEAELYDWGREREFAVTLNFPLYQGVEEVWIGLDAEAVVSAPPAYAASKPVIIYGTSITQGGCASRPGMAYTNILSRAIPLEFINLGFSGNGRGEPEVARAIAQIPNPALLVLDYEANSGTVEQLKATLPKWIRIYRESHRDVPIVVISNIRYAKDRFDEALLELHNGRRKVQQETVDRLRREGDTHIHFIDGFHLLGEESDECTVDGVHPTDLGFLRIARSLEPQFRKLLRFSIPELQDKIDEAK